jgi:hypothetical protein
VGHAGTRLLTGLADKTGLTRSFIQALGLERQRRSAHEPGRVAVDLAVLLADGGETIAELGVLRQQPDLFGAVASDATAWRVLDAIDEPALARLRAARAAARALAWLQLAETRRRVPATTVLDRVLPGVRPGHRRDDRGMPLGERIGCGDVEAHVRLPPAAVFPRRHR